MKILKLLPLSLCLPVAAQAVDFTWSGFGTIGYAISDQSYAYQRYIDEQGTFSRDSVLGTQVDARLNPNWGAALQIKLAPPDNSDYGLKGYLSWAFLSWRPRDDLLVRAGKLRVPMMLNTENSDVGATYDFARLPIEVYSIAPITDFVGLSVSKSWLAGELEWSLDGYYGKAKNYTRLYGREIRDGDPTPGSWFRNLDVSSGGLVLTARTLDSVFRAGIHEAKVSHEDGLISDIPYRPAAGGRPGFYDLASGPRVDSIVLPVQTLGASVLMPAGVRVTGEYVRTRVSSASSGLSRWGAYLALSRQFGPWNPYLSYARTKSTAQSLSFYRAVNGNTSPAFPASLNNYQRLTADIISPYDQSTTALGTSFRLNNRGLAKAEWAQTRTGEVSSFVDAPVGGESGGKRINVFSLSYSFSF